MVIGWVSQLFLLLYRSNTSKNISQKEKMGHFEKLLKFHHIIATNNRPPPIRNVDYMKYLFIWLLLVDSMVLYLHLVARLIW